MRQRCAVAVMSIVPASVDVYSAAHFASAQAANGNLLQVKFERESVQEMGSNLSPGERGLAQKLLQNYCEYKKIWHYVALGDACAEMNVCQCHSVLCYLPVSLPASVRLCVFVCADRCSCLFIDLPACLHAGMHACPLSSCLGVLRAGLPAYLPGIICL